MLAIWQSVGRMATLAQVDAMVLYFVPKDLSQGSAGLIN